MGLLCIWALPVLLGASVSVCWLTEGQRSMDTANRPENPSQGPQTRKSGHADGVADPFHSGSDGGPCRRTYCGRGRQCVLLEVTGRAECVCQEKCRPTFVPVCGSDSRFYENHCEVYRTACLQKRRIYVVHSKDCFFKGDTCTMAEYNKLKSMLLDMQPKGLTGGDRNTLRDMDQKRALVDTMFKYLDVDRDGRLGSDELAQISMKEHLEDSLLECTMQDLLRYDDYNNDGHLTLHEFYTAFLSTGSPLNTANGQTANDEKSEDSSVLHTTLRQAKRVSMATVGASVILE